MKLKFLAILSLFFNNIIFATKLDEVIKNHPKVAVATVFAAGGISFYVAYFNWKKEPEENKPQPTKIDNRQIQQAEHKYARQMLELQLSIKNLQRLAG